MFTILLYDGITALILAGIPAYILWRFRRNKPHDSSWDGLVISVLVLVWCAVFFGSFIEPKLLTVKKYDVHLGDTGGRLRLAVISDIHLGGYRDELWAKKIVERVNTLKADAVIIDGDVVTTPTGIDELAPFRDLQSTYGSFASLGNWDYRIGAVDVRKRLGSYGVKMLWNRSVKVGSGAKELRLIGLDDFIYGQPDWDTAMSEVPADAVKVLVVHNPDFAPQAELHGINLAVTGHTHCGQIRLPLIGPVPPLPTHIGRQFDCGLFDYGQLKLFITPGVGEFGPRARFFNPAEISVLDISY